MDCIFCKIITGEIPSAKVYEDDAMFVFLDINPVSEGHCLVIPKKHFENVFDMDDETLGKISATGKKIAKILKEKLGADGINFLQSNGASAGQVVFHYHLHVIPRKEDDGLKKHGLFGERHEKADPAHLTELAEKLKS